ncbi:uncharacterized protein LAESUDRAFT_808352 [Laetiporus sulphureus 93-53]|uniref:Uncharacterized protein n=1 Tax=Laetiporus sulphureus 93-53 TaxID=1314785 RepID=A0A165IAU4_9APHY|nr:uncharacterized protein LAESUDRAFT_808352 [Laetiporus sulphureus 93-53]KZT12821.1 hypothetical protein LAESUDRAFT_808352 [Laetiporus sulphureus 93-53]
MSSPPTFLGSLPTRRKPMSKAPPGFLVPPKPHVIPISRMTVRELRDQHARNARTLAGPTASTSSYSQRIVAEQAEIESRLVDLVGLKSIQNKLEETKIHDHNDEAMNTDPTPQEPQYRAIGAKQRALEKFAAKASRDYNGGGLSFEEATRLEQEAHAADRRRQEEIAERRRRRGLSLDDEVLTRQEKEARMWAFMNYKPTDSDLEDEDDEGEEGKNPSTWFDDDQDDGRKGQDIVYPDYHDDLSNIIRIDESRIPYSIPREE